MAFSRDKTNKAAWVEFINSAEQFINSYSQHPGYINSIATTIMDNYKTFKDNASLNKALLWVQQSMKVNPDYVALNTIEAELLKATGKKKK